MHLYHQLHRMHSDQMALLCDLTGANMAPFSLCSSLGSPTEAPFSPYSALGNLTQALRVDDRFSGGTYCTVEGLLHAMDARAANNHAVQVTKLFVVLPNNGSVGSGKTDKFLQVRALAVLPCLAHLVCP